jgi:hypothetical protein
MGSRARAEGVVPALVRRGKEGPWAWDPRAGGAGGEGGREEAEEVLTDDEELRAAGNGTAHVEVRRGCGSAIEQRR